MSEPYGAGPQCQACRASLPAPYTRCMTCGVVQDRSVRVGYASAPVYPPPTPSAGTVISSSSPYFPMSQSSAPLPVPYGSPASVPMAYSGQPQIVRVVAPKSPGIAVLLTLLWLGAGHLYANRVATGLVLMALDLVLVLMSFSVFMLVFTIPVWVIAVPVTMIFASRAVHDFNHRNGVVLR